MFMNGVAAFTPNATTVLARSADRNERDLVQCAIISKA